MMENIDCDSIEKIGLFCNCFSLFYVARCIEYATATHLLPRIFPSYFMWWDCWDVVDTSSIEIEIRVITLFYVLFDCGKCVKQITSMCFLLTFFKIALWNEGVSVHHSPFITIRDGGKMDAARRFLFSARKFKLAIVREEHRLFQFRAPIFSPLWMFSQVVPRLIRLLSKFLSTFCASG